MMKMFKYLRSFSKSRYRQWRSQIDNSYLVYGFGKHLATLENVKFCEMFWNYYELNPATKDESLIKSLYCHDLWLSDDVRFIGNKTGFSYQFFLAGIEDGYWLDDMQQKVYLKDRPKQVLLRGPYLI